MQQKECTQMRSKNMLFCVVSRKEIVEIKEIVSEYDPRAFFIVSDAREVFGEGFIEDKNPANIITKVFGDNQAKI